jgi:trigger factor
MDHTNAEHKKYYKNIKVTKLPHSEIEIEGEIDKDRIKECRKEAIKNLGQNVNLPGFRKGHIPENILVGKLGEMTIMEEAAEIALSHEYIHIVADHKLDVVSRPHITLTKIAPENDLGFKIKVAIFPEFSLPDYKKIAKSTMKEKEEIEVTEKELNEVIDQLRKNVAGNAGEVAGHEHEKHTENERGSEELAQKELGKSTGFLPEVNDEFIKKFGDFKGVEDFKNKIRENLIKEKEARLKEKKRITIGEEIIKKIDVDLPETMIEGELQKMHAEFTDSIEKMGIKTEDYLKHTKKTVDDLKKDWREDAKKRVLMQMILNKIALAEKIQPEEADIAKEVKHITEHHKDANPMRIRGYVEMMLSNEKVFQFLEGQE